MNHQPSGLQHRRHKQQSQGHNARTRSCIQKKQNLQSECCKLMLMQAARVRLACCNATVVSWYVTVSSCRCSLVILPCSCISVRLFFLTVCCSVYPAASSLQNHTPILDFMLLTCISMCLPCVDHVSGLSPLTLG